MQRRRTRRPDWSYDAPSQSATRWLERRWPAGKQGAVARTAMPRRRTSCDAAEPVGPSGAATPQREQDPQAFFGSPPLLLHAEHRREIEAPEPAAGDVAREQRQGEYQERRASQHQRIFRRDMEEERLKVAGGSERQPQAGQRAEPADGQPVAQGEPEHLAPPGSESHSYPHLVMSPRQRM